MGKYSQRLPIQTAEQSSTDRRLTGHTPGLALDRGVANPELKSLVPVVSALEGFHSTRTSASSSYGQELEGNLDVQLA